jgi:ABC-2 type transport system ATP-binding protein
VSDTTDSPSPQPEADIDKRPEAILGRPEIPSEDVPVVIDVSHVQMIFNMASEELGSLKEYFIKIARHELFFKEFHALEDITFQVRRGEAFGLVGTNGSGKSTMLKIIAGVLEPSKGSVRVDGSIAPLIELGAGFDMELTAKENIYLNGSLLGYSKAFIDEKFDDIVDFAELRDFMDMPLKNYSSGMVARIAFAIATITVPDVLIVDETLSVGDFLFQEKCMRRIRELVETNNCTVLLVSHDISLVEQICDRVCWIEHGHQRMLGPTDEVCAAYKALGA